jgi:hypothetical protein
MFRSALVSISAVALVSCGTPTACPAVLHGASLTIRLADGWGEAEPRSVTLRCPDGVVCGLIAPDDLTVLPEPEEVPVPPPGSAPMPTPEPSPEIGGTSQDLDDGEATYFLDGPRDELVVTVHGADGVLVERTVTPDWVQVGGSEECGGPTEAEVVVPAP